MLEVQRGVREEDISPVATMLRSYWKERGMLYTNQWAERYLKQGHTLEFKREQWLVLKEKEKIIGTIAVIVWEGNVAELRDFIVKKEHRQRGCGTKLLQHALEWCRTNNIRKIYALIFQQYKSFFEKRNFKMEGFLRSHFKEGEDLLIMSIFPEKKQETQMNLKEKLEDLKKIENIEEETAARLRKLSVRRKFT